MLCPRRPAARPPHGFTLIELMITLVVAVILICIAVPNFSSMLWAMRLNTAADQLTDVYNAARLDSVKLNAPTMVCGNVAQTSTDPLVTACGSTQPGMAYATTGSAATPLLTSPLLTSPVLVSGTFTAIRYSGLGLGETVGTTVPYTGLVADVCTASISQGNHRQISMTAGGILTTTTTTGTCP